MVLVVKLGCEGSPDEGVVAPKRLLESNRRRQTPVLSRTASEISPPVTAIRSKGTSREIAIERQYGEYKSPSPFRGNPAQTLESSMLLRAAAFRLPPFRLISSGLHPTLEMDFAQWPRRQQFPSAAHRKREGISQALRVRLESLPRSASCST